jgi:hypothetical protein
MTRCGNAMKTGHDHAATVELAEYLANSRQTSLMKQASLNAWRAAKHNPMTCAAGVLMAPISTVRSTRQGLLASVSII